MRDLRAPNPNAANPRSRMCGPNRAMGPDGGDRTRRPEV